MRAYGALGLLIEMYLTASYEGFGSPATVGNEIPGVPTLGKGQSSSEGVGVRNWRVYREMQNLEREIEKLNERFTSCLREVRGEAPV